MSHRKKIQEFNKFLLNSFTIKKFKEKLSTLTEKISTLTEEHKVMNLKINKIKAITFLKKKLENNITEKEVIEILIEITKLYILNGNYKKPLSILEEYKEQMIPEKFFSEYTIVIIDYNIGACYFHLKKYEKVRDIYEILYHKMVKFKEDTCYEPLVIEYYLISSYYFLKEYHLVTEYSETYIQKYKKYIKDGKELNIKLYNALSYFNLKIYDKGKELIFNILPAIIAKYGKENKTVTILKSNLIHCYLVNKNLKKAFVLSNEIFDLQNKFFKINDIIKIQKNIIKLSFEKKDIDKEYDVINKTILLYRDLSPLDINSCIDLHYRRIYILETFYKKEPFVISTEYINLIDRYIKYIGEDENVTRMKYYIGYYNFITIPVINEKSYNYLKEVLIIYKSKFKDKNDMVIELLHLEFIIKFMEIEKNNLSIKKAKSIFKNTVVKLEERSKYFKPIISLQITFKIEIKKIIENIKSTINDPV